MFDIGFSELVVIAVVALIVIGPERLPRVARTAGILLGRVRRYAADVKADINREIQLEELRQMQQEVYERVMAADAATRNELNAVEQKINQAIEPPMTGEGAADAASSTVQGVESAAALNSASTAVSPAPTFATGSAASDPSNPSVQPPAQPMVAGMSDAGKHS